MQEQDRLYMQRALELAERGRGTVSPNPMVGCVIVHDGKIIGEGWHRQYGEGHAEVNAVNSVEDQSLLSESTCYVTLEPCSHYGKTPPCCDMLISHGVKRVVIAVEDSHPLVRGRGIKRMKEAGVQVECGLMEQEARQLNARFFLAIDKQRPYIILKWAQTADGFIARKNYDSKWISGPRSRQQVHLWRAQEDAIMVATNTAYYDNPRLNVRGVEGTDPVRVVIDKKLRLQIDLNLFDGQQPTLCYNLQKTEQQKNLDFVKLEEADFMPQLFEDLKQRKVRSVIVEGGTQLLNDLIEKGLWDEARVFTSPARFEEGIAAPELGLTSSENLSIAEDQLNIYHNPEPK